MVFGFTYIQYTADIRVMIKFHSTSELYAQSRETNNPPQHQCYHVQHIIHLGVGGGSDLLYQAGDVRGSKRDCFWFCLKPKRELFDDFASSCFMWTVGKGCSGHPDCPTAFLMAGGFVLHQSLVAAASERVPLAAGWYFCPDLKL